MRVLMVGNDTSIIEGRQGKFTRVLDIFRHGWERVDIVLPRARNRLRSNQIDNVYFHLSPLPKNFQAWFVVKKLNELIAEHQHDLILLHSDGLFRNSIGVWWVWRKTGIPIISEIHHVPGHPRAGGWQDVVQKNLLNLYVRWAKMHVTKFRAVNHQEVPKYLMRVCKVPEDQILVVPSVFVEEGFYPQDVEKTYDLMFCGRLVPNKGLDLLLDTFALLRKNRPQTTLLIKGEGPLETQLWRQAKKIGVADGITQICWVGSPDDLAELYLQSRILVCSSYNEGGPRVTVEAMACGVPVVSTRVGIMNELIENGVNGYLVNWDAAEIAQRCLCFLNNPDSQYEMGNKGKETVLGLTAESVVGNYITAFQSIIRQEKPAAQG